MHVETFSRDPKITSMTAESPHVELKFLALTIAHSRAVPIAIRGDN